MSRYIDADAYAAEMKVRQDALKELMDDADALDNWEMYDGLSRAFSVFVEAKLTLDNMPTVDAVPVVRCRDCKWAEVDAWWTYCKLGHKEDTTNSIIYTCTHNFYCADGERKDGETEQCNTYSLGKIEMPKGAIEQIIADGERKDGERRSDGE